MLGTNLEASRDRFQIGDVTRTTSRNRKPARRSPEQPGNHPRPVGFERGEFRRVIGQRPGVLAPPPPLPPLPATADQAVQIALVSNPDFIAVTRQAEAARYDVRVAQAARLPTVSGVASGDYVNTLAGDTGNQPRSGTATSIGVQSRIPLYQGGLPAARIAQSQAFEAQTLEQRVATERAVIATTRSAFATYQAAQEAIASNQIAVNAHDLALEGARAENGVGTRTILDVLNAEQELLNSQVELVTARREAYVAGFQLLNAMGQAEADDLGRRADRSTIRSAITAARRQLERLGPGAAPGPVGTAPRLRRKAPGPDPNLGYDAAIGIERACRRPRPIDGGILASIKRVIAEEKECVPRFRRRCPRRGSGRGCPGTRRSGRGRAAD